MNNLARLGTALKADMAGVSNTNMLDAPLVRLCEAVSRDFESACGRRFSAVQGTRYMSGAAHPDSRYLWLPEDLCSITSVTVDSDGDGDYDMTLTADVDYWAWPYEAPEIYEPHYRLELNPNGGQLTSWPAYPRSVKVVGLWGYSYELQSTGLTVQGGGINASTLTATLSGAAEALVFPGDVLVLESEQIDVAAVSATSVTFGARGINGTTAAAHAASVVAYVRRYPRPVEQAIAERTIGLRWDSQGGYDSAVTLIGDATGAATKSTGRGAYARWQSAVNRFSRPEVR